MDRAGRTAEGRRRQRVLLAVLGAVAVIAVAVAVVVALRGRDGRGESTGPGTYRGPLAPASRTPDGATVMTRAGVTRPVLEIFEDFQCPVCRAMEHIVGPTIKKLAAEGRVRVVYWPFQLFRGPASEPLASNSRRAANAALCAPVDRWPAYHDTLYAHQPEEGVAGFEPAQLVAWGRETGITDAGFAACVEKMHKAAQVDVMTRYATRTRKVDATPTVFLNGRALDLQAQLLDAGALERAVLDAGRG
ncbi:DsbA family protein [Actinomadura miaoliensis]|uniref:DsbA family protein n=1 Tax=Actinomadura miaoliensis TaxID=430685 RepID=UPI0031ED06F0